MLIIFDVDGTLISGEAADWKCFGEAYTHVTGDTLDAAFWKGITEVTAKAIIHKAVESHPVERRNEIESAVRDEFVRRLKAAHAGGGNPFAPMPGARLVLEYLDEQAGIEVAIATGDWHESISFKLSAAGIDVSKYPMATASDRHARADIIRLAAERAGRGLEDAIYIGDGLWDFRACQKLGIPFLGVGYRNADLLAAGAAHALPVLEHTAFVEWFGRFRDADARGERDLFFNAQPS